jgi:hypothetical protein
MAKSKIKRDPIPENFKSIEQAAEFWDTPQFSGLLGLDASRAFQSQHQTSSLPCRARAEIDEAS